MSGSAAAKKERLLTDRSSFEPAIEALRETDHSEVATPGTIADDHDN